jgi:outer membrane receptor for ferrienterochelin and colicins
MSSRLRRTLLASAISSLACGAAVAQETPQLNDIVVTASGFEQQISSAPASISVISREELERGYYQNVTDALRDVPGVVVTGGGRGDNGNDISIRGMPSQYTLILVDGRPINSRESRPNGDAGFEQDWLPPLQAIERIEVVRGPMSTPVSYTHLTLPTTPYV